ncbi:MAG: phosphomevalonate kinase [Candidatus Aenigmatarchaeota archaeon]
MVHTSAPGKQMLAGEWSVLELGNPCIVAAVNKRVHVEIEESEEISITVDDFNIKDVKADFNGKQLAWKNADDKEKEKLIFIKGAIETALQYLGDYKSFKLRSWGEESQIVVDGVAKKVGFGSSAACVVATVSGLLKFNGYDIDCRESNDIIYKLSTIAHYFAQGKVGSAFDVAASTYGGATVYKRFDPIWLTKRIESETVKKIAEEDWPYFFVEELKVSDDFILLVGWTKESASTSAMVKQMDNFKNNDFNEYKRIYDGISKLVCELIDAWKVNDQEEILALIKKNEEYLRELGQKSGVNIETKELKQLVDIANENGAAGKLSGAGGGDCGIAVCFSSDVVEKIIEEWQNAGLYPLDVSIDYDGVREE